MTDARIRVCWTSRDVPLEARAVVATGTVAKLLARRLLELDDSSLRALSGLAARELIIVLGNAAELPWVDGVAYLGRDESAPALLLPTALRPSVPPAVLQAAVKKLVTTSSSTAVLASPARLIPCGAARSIDRAVLQGWLETA